MKNILCALFLMYCFPLPGQETMAPRTEALTIESRILEEDRSLMVQLPQNYSPDRKYPVSSLLDAESLFEGHKDVVEFLSQKNIIPEMIIVGIVNTQRSRDFTHGAAPPATSSRPAAGPGSRHFSPKN